MNAKEELLVVLKTFNLSVIDYENVQFCFIDDVSAHMELDESNDFQKLLEFLDRDYDNGFGAQELYGTIYCIDDNGVPVWLTRGEYDGQEWWNANTIPSVYKNMYNCSHAIRNAMSFLVMLCTSEKLDKEVVNEYAEICKSELKEDCIGDNIIKHFSSLVYSVMNNK
jgi:hypothetical protein